MHVLCVLAFLAKDTYEHVWSTYYSILPFKQTISGRIVGVLPTQHLIITPTTEHLSAHLLTQPGKMREDTRQ